MRSVFKWPLLFVIIIPITIAFILDFQLKRRSDPQVFPKAAIYKGVIKREYASYESHAQFVIQLNKRVRPLDGTINKKVLLTIGEACSLKEGSTVEFKSKLSIPKYFLNPGVFNYKQFLKRKGLFIKAFVPSCLSIHVEKIPFPSKRQKILTRIRDHIRQNSLNAPVLQALLLGTKTINKNDREKIKDLGLSHLFVISGTHFGMMVFLIYGFVSLILNFFPKIYLFYPRQKIAALVTMLFTLFYLWLVHSHASVVRAGIMTLLFLLSIILERQRNTLYTVYLAALFLLCLNPLMVFDISFHLSFLCVTIIVVFVRKLSVKNKLLKVFLSVVFINLSLVPYILYTFGEASLSGVIHNVWAIPYFQISVIPLSLLYLFFSVFSLPYTDTVLIMWDGSLTLFNKILTFTDYISIPMIDAFTPNFIHVLLFYVLLYSLFFARRLKIKLAVLGLLFFSMLYTYYENHLSYDWRISQIDVGQGDASLIQSRDKTVLIDTGGSQYIDTGDYVLIPVLRKLWVRKIDLLIITHGDIDHFGGALKLINSVPVDEVWINPKPAKDENYVLFLKKIKERKIELKKIHKPTEVKLGKLKLSVLNPRKDQMLSESDNDYSIVIKIDHQKISALFTGDISQKTEKKLIDIYGDQLRSSILKVAHHGSLSSSSIAFLREVEPKYALIGVGRNSRFGHPHQKVLRRFANRKTFVLRTDLHGMVQIEVKNGKINGIELIQGEYRAF